MLEKIFNSFFKHRIKYSKKKVIDFVRRNKNYFESDYFNNEGKVKKRMCLYEICLVDKETSEKIEISAFEPKFYFALIKSIAEHLEITVKKVEKTKAKALIAGGAKIYDASKLRS